jgi:hypothetical protein
LAFSSRTAAATSPDRTVVSDHAGSVSVVDRRELTPLFHTNMTPYGEIQLRTDRRLDLSDLPTM